MPRWLRILLLLLGIFGTALFLPAPGLFRPAVPPPAASLPPAPDAPRVLFLGNSLVSTNDIPGLLRALSSSTFNVPALAVSSLAAPGVSLEWHWKNSETLKLLNERVWDVVVLQEQSGRSFEDKRAFHADLQQFSERFAQQARRIVLYAIGSRLWGKPAQLDLNRFTSCEAELFGWEAAPISAVWDKVGELFPGYPIYAEDEHHPGKGGALVAAAIFLRIISPHTTITFPEISPEPPELMKDLLRQRFSATARRKTAYELGKLLASIDLKQLSSCDKARAVERQSHSDTH